MKKIILWLSVSVALLAAAMFAVVKKMPYFSPSGKSTGDLVYAGADELTGITVRFGKEKIKLRKLDGSWLVNGYYGRNAAADRSPAQSYVPQTAAEAAGNSRQLPPAASGFR